MPQRIDLGLNAVIVAVTDEVPRILVVRRPLRRAASEESSIEDALPAFVTVVLIPLTLSITQGILWGFLLHALLYAVAGRWREVSLTLWLLAALSAGLLLLGH